MVINVDEYDPAWPAQAQAVIAELQAAHPTLFTSIEHVGSTAIPGLPAKPVIDLMAAVDALEAPPEIGLRFTLTDTGMPDRYFYRREPDPSGTRAAADQIGEHEETGPTGTRAGTDPDAARAGADQIGGHEENGPDGTRAGTDPGRGHEGRPAGGRELPVHLHVVARASWETRNERLLRDFLLRHADGRAEYGRLKRSLAAAGLDGGGYTRGKTELIQRLVDAARDERGLPRVPVWEE